ncbi:MAG TPA: glycoside hydrolase family 127 protein [Haliscomenobacter sp.]|uniref:glycoside hydrolase family 127 protein n=1 Tax=Haliscomenobacter sp. TaxID=2717303 RepID=UPI002BE60B55|nr:beta-L-arabinofuranosidase domain-containing protein [Haliscomenobacter sp.]HOY19298.1 glycoside hydrolase family 127 protein [Haliscomenobacter sp.]HPH19373.1 glycoside hydrolase family 127 protein [Haliscomenobacter sp.]
MKNQIGYRLLIFCCCSALSLGGQNKFANLAPVKFSTVQITDAFWKPRMDKVASVTVPVCIEQTEVKTGRIRNFERVAGTRDGKFEGIFYDDSDVFKALEAMAYTLKTKPDPKLEAKCDEWIDKIAAAQQKDGYINTYYTLTGLDKRWTDMSMHEDYNTGHLLEAAVAYYNATGKRKLLDVGIRMVEHMMSLFGPGKRHWVTGHQELELALVKLYQVSKDKRFLDFSHWLLEERGHGYAHGYTWTDWKDTAYAQDIKPVSLTTQITGHAVRAMYLYTGAADVAAYTGDEGYLKAMNTVWDDVVERNMYITGGIGSSGSNEGFSKDYDLPNERAYCETCASVGMVFWNQRMNRLTGQTKFIDVLEKSLYNGALDGLSLAGDRFFYGNPLASSGTHFRREWFGTACCPSNIARLIASLGDYIYASDPQSIYVNLFVGSNTSIDLAKGKVEIRQETEYPWKGMIKLTVNPEQPQSFALKIRLPGWAKGNPGAGALYKFLDEGPANFATLKVNGQAQNLKLDNGYLILERSWNKGDVVELNLAMPIRRVVARDEVKDNENRMALQRGPLVYCVEGVDHNGSAWNLIVPDQVTFTPQWRPDLLGGVMTLTGTGMAIVPTKDGIGAQTIKQKISAVPYFSWCNRGSNQMLVWLPRKVKEIKIP